MMFTFTQVLILLGVVVLLLRVKSLNISFDAKPESKLPPSHSDSANPLSGIGGLESVAALLLAHYAQTEAHPERLLPSSSGSGKRRSTSAKRLKLEEES